jgi:predicted adenylyl cyclase CyaB
MGKARRNVELKAIEPDRNRSLEVCRGLGAEDRGELWQRDTYFAVPTGRLKLREQQPGRAHLIHYERPDQPEERESRYRVAFIDEPKALVDRLGVRLGVRVIVIKRRRLFLHGSVRVHLDDVEGLGRFIELEAVAPIGSDLTNERRLIAELRSAFGVHDELLVATGYADKLEAASYVHMPPPRVL